MGWVVCLKKYVHLVTFIEVSTLQITVSLSLQHFLLTGGLYSFLTMHELPLIYALCCFNSLPYSRLIVSTPVD